MWNVAVSGFVDDNIKVDESDVDWRRDIHEFENSGITDAIADLQSRQFGLELWDYPRADYAGPNEVRLGDTNGHPFLVEWTWKVPVAVTGPDFVCPGETAQMGVSWADGGPYSWSVSGAAASIGADGILTALTTGVAVVTASNAAGWTVAKDVTVFQVEGLSVDAFGENGAATLHCRVAPDGATLPYVSFTGPGVEETLWNVSGTFGFSYNQHDIPQGVSEMSVRHCRGAVSVSILREGVGQGPAEEIVIATMPVDPGWVHWPIAHSLTETYWRISYSVPVLSGTRTLWLGASHVTVEISQPVSIDWVNELHRYHDSLGNHDQQGMALFVGGPVLPPMTSSRKYFDSTNDVFRCPGMGLRGMAQLDAIQLDGTIPMNLANENVDQMLE